MSQETRDAIKELGTDIKNLLSGVVLGAEGRIYPDKSQLGDLAKRTVLDEDIRKNRPHVAPDTVAMVEVKSGPDGLVLEELNPDDDARVKALKDCEGKPCFDELLRIIGLPIEGGLRRAELRAIRGKGGHVVGGRPSKAETVNAYALRIVDKDSDFERVVLRVTCLVGGRRYMYDPAFPTSADPKCKRRVRITQQGGKQRLGAQTGAFEYVPKGSPYFRGSEEFPTAADLPDDGIWMPIREVPQRQVYGKGLVASAEIETVDTEPRLRPQWNDPYRRTS